MRRQLGVLVRDAVLDNIERVNHVNEADLLALRFALWLIR